MQICCALFLFNLSVAIVQTGGGRMDFFLREGGVGGLWEMGRER